ncbi:MAG: ABC transporter substrate-binding protein [Alphaproteobacteria bacterium]|nr:ABC transporter substrate-binding protein [Alphaproteobacteria bacterium]
MKRRSFVASLGAVAASGLLPIAAVGQARKKIGFLYPGRTAAGSSRLAAFREGLRSAGLDPTQIEIVPRYAETVVERNAVLARELVEAKVDVLVAISVISVEVARAATKTIPIVAFDLETDPVASGLAANLARPGGNVTGVYFDYLDFSTKWMELLKEAIPRLAKVVVVRDPASPSPQLKGIETTAVAMAVKVEVVDIRTAAEFDAAFRSVRERGPDAVLILSSPLFGADPAPVAQQALVNRLPAITLFPEFARAGGFMAYGVSLLGAIQQCGGRAGKVLNGAKVAELPIERPTNFELVVNAKTAKILGIELPTSILLRANEVIE